MIEPPAQTRSPVFLEDSSAATYREIHLPRVFAPWAAILLEIVPTLPGDSVLDVATGPGTVALRAARLAGPHGRVVGVDFSSAMLRIARAWPAEPGAAPIEYIESSAMSMPLPDATFDVAYCQQGLQHMSDPRAALREMRRLLKVDGRIGVATWQRSPFGLFREVVARMGYSAPGVQSSSFGRDASELVSTLRDIGFKDIELETRELTAVLEGGIPQALELAVATSAAAGMEAAPADRQQALRAAIADALQPFLKDGAVELLSIAHICRATAAS